MNSKLESHSPRQRRFKEVIGHESHERLISRRVTRSLSKQKLGKDNQPQSDQRGESSQPKRKLGSGNEDGGKRQRQQGGRVKVICHPPPGDLMSRRVTRSLSKQKSASSDQQQQQQLEEEESRPGKKLDGYMSDVSRSSCGSELDEDKVKEMKANGLRYRYSFTSKEYKEYSEKVDASEGFDVGDNFPRDVMICGLLRPIRFKRNSKESKLLKLISRYALGSYNASRKVNFKYCKIIKANGMMTYGITRYITFCGREKKTDPYVNFQTRTYSLKGNTNIEMVRLEPPRL